MNFQRKQAIFNLLMGLLATILILIFRPEPKFDYDFENFFSQDNDELKFYQDFRNTFENDNDYLLLALGNRPDIFDSIFLEKAFRIQLMLDSLSGVEETISILTVDEPVISPFGMRFRKALDWSSNSALANSKSKVIQDRNLAVNFFSESAEFLLIQIKNKQRISKEEGDILYGKILEVLEKSEIESFHIAGKIRAQGEFVALMQNEFGFFCALSFLLIAFVLWLLFRVWWAVAVPLLVLAIGIIWSIALQLWAGKALDLMSVMLPTILAIVGLAAMIHFMNKYRALVKEGSDKEAAIRKAYSQLVFPVFLTSLTTALGFFTLYFTDVPVLKFFGLFTALGVMLMLLAVIGLSPGLFYLFPGFKTKLSPIEPERWEPFLRLSLMSVIRYQRKIALFFLIATLGSIYLSNQLKINGFILDSLPQDSELSREFKFFDDEFGGSKPIEIHLQVGPREDNVFDRDVLLEIEKIEGFAMEHFGASSLVSPLSVAKFLNKAQNGGNDKAYVIPSRGQLERLKPLILKWDEISPVRLFSNDQRQGRVSGRSPDFGSYRSEKEKLRFDQFILDEINPEVLRVRLTGTSHLIDMSHQNVSVQLAKGIGIAFMVVAVVVGFLFRSWLLPILVLIPNVIPLFWVAGVMWLIGAELSLSTAIIFTVAFGIAVDDTIHFMSKLQSEYRQGKSWLYAIKRTYLETGKSIVLSSLVLTSGFGILVFSQFGVTFYVGLLISLALFFALIADMVLLPVLMFFYHKVEKSRSIF
jgi:predicted RND superfamily exporter protein